MPVLKGAELREIMFAGLVNERIFEDPTTPVASGPITG